MQYLPLDIGKANEIKQLYQSVFGHSDGAAEGESVANLAYQLITATPLQDRYGFVLEDNDIIGCIIFSRITFGVNNNAFILSPVAIHTGYQKQGLGQQLIRFGINQLKKQGAELLMTYGDPNYYSKLGFQPVPVDVIRPPFPLSFPHGWLGQSLIIDAIETMAGKVACVPALMDRRYW